jgi:succinate dehydrogenase / fumarate reductase cytochrome b subunit
MAIVSILHRISGVVVFLLIPLLLWSLEVSLVSPEGLAEVKDQWQTPLCKLLVWGLFAGLVFHLFAGIRHLLMDVHFGDSHVAGKVGAILVVVSSIIVVAAAYWYWG